MYHQEMYDALVDSLPKAKKLSVLDLGCGDAYAISKALANVKVSSYTGVDLSEDALTHAQSNLEPLGFELELIEGDFLDTLRKLEKHFDIIVAGYSLHHLQKAQTTELFGEVKKRLKKDGQFLYYDEMCQEGESQKAYIEKLWKIACEDWGTLTETEFEMLKLHIFENDFPLSKSSVKRMCQEAGFKEPKICFRDATELFVFMDLC
jgi:cyclopropane fatty-acyl-phospholipid synthase-like methyltransferase